MVCLRWAVCREVLLLLGTYLTHALAVQAGDKTLGRPLLHPGTAAALAQVRVQECGGRGSVPGLRVLEVGGSEQGGQQGEMEDVRARDCCSGAVRGGSSRRSWKESMMC